MIRLYLWASDCDGMCNHCEGKLRDLCFEYKGKSKYESNENSKR